jgi:hypothetical protein
VGAQARPESQVVGAQARPESQVASARVEVDVDHDQLQERVTELSIDTAGRSTAEKLRFTITDEVRAQNAPELLAHAWKQQHVAYLNTYHPRSPEDDPREKKRREIAEQAATQLCLQLYNAHLGEHDPLDGQVIDFLLSLLQVQPQGEGPLVALVTREEVRHLSQTIYKVAKNTMFSADKSRLAEFVRKHRECRPDLIAFPVNSDHHHFAVLLHRCANNVVEVVTLDSNWGGFRSLQEYRLNNAPLYPDQATVLGGLDKGGAQMVVLDGYLQFVCAMLAQIYWPAPLAEPRKVIQRFPLLPHQGAT